MDQDLQKPDASRAHDAPSGPNEPLGSLAREASDVPNGTVRTLRRIAVGLIGGTVLAVGVLMIVTPGPAIVVIPAGLAILAVEFQFARRWLRAAKERAQKISMRTTVSNGPGKSE
jgi:uncharacterized protein (TIGR02611 family)